MLPDPPPCITTCAAAALVLAGSCSAPGDVRELNVKVNRILAETKEQSLGSRRRDALRPDPVGQSPGVGARDAREESLPLELRSFDLRESLETAFATNRQMQSQRESLFLTALGLTSTRHDFNPQVSTLLSYFLADSGDGPRTQDGDFDVSLSQILRGGGSLAFNAGTSWGNTQGSLDDSYSSAVSISLAQPLLRGAGSLISHESLVQAERSMVYAIRDFQLFQENFSIDVANSYYDLVEQQKALDNQARSLETSEFGRNKAEALFSIGRSSQIEVLRARRQELEDRNSLIAAEENYQFALDRFKVFTLGIDTAIPIEIVPQDPPFIDVEWDLSSAIDVAFANRLDYLTLREQLEDSERGLRIVRNGLRSDLDLTAAYNLAGDSVSEFGDQDLNDDSWSAGVTWRPAVDRVDERNSYRSAQIQYLRTVRNLEEFEDNLVIEIRSAFRQLARIKQSVAIQTQLIEDQQKNLRKAQIEFDQGNVSNREVVDAQQSLVGAQNSLISEQVNYEIARLRLMRNLGILFVDDQGVWMER